MKSIKKFDYYITAVFVITIIVIITISFFTFKEIFARSHQKQQAAIMPLFSLITSEIIRPITVSQYMASDPFLLDYIQQDEIDNDVVFNYISNISTKFNTLSFIAIEKHLLLIDSNNKVTSTPNPENGVTYKVQVGAGHKTVASNYFAAKFNLQDNVSTINHEGWIKYLVGSFGEYKLARDKRNKVRNNVKTAFVTAYNSGQRITVQEALMISNQKWYK